MYPYTLTVSVAGVFVSSSSFHHVFLAAFSGHYITLHYITYSAVYTLSYSGECIQPARRGWCITGGKELMVCLRKHKHLLRSTANSTVTNSTPLALRSSPMFATFQSTVQYIWYSQVLSECGATILIKGIMCSVTSFLVPELNTD